MGCPTNEPDINFSVLCTSEIDENMRNPLMLCGPHGHKIHASMYFMSICPLAHHMMLGTKEFDPCILP